MQKDFITSIIEQFPNVLSLFFVKIMIFIFGMTFLFADYNVDTAIKFKRNVQFYILSILMFMSALLLSLEIQKNSELFYLIFIFFILVIPIFMTFSLKKLYSYARKIKKEFPIEAQALNNYRNELQNNHKSLLGTGKLFVFSLALGKILEQLTENIIIFNIYRLTGINSELLGIIVSVVFGTIVYYSTKLIVNYTGERVFLKIYDRV